MKVSALIIVVLPLQILGVKVNCTYTIRLSPVSAKKDVGV